MAQPDEPLYDFPEPAQPSEKKVLGHQRSQGSLRSVSVLDRLLLTVPVWLQLSINPATALHILQREPPGTFLVRKSRTSQRNVLCVRLTDDSVPSFVQQFGIREEQPIPSLSPALTLETSAISFPDLPRLISFYCVSRDVLPFPLELPEAIARATSHKELESISHMGIEFWNSHLNVRGPRETPKPHKDQENKPDEVTSAPPADPTLPASDSTSQPGAKHLLTAEPESDPTTQPTLFHEFCPITTRSPRDLDCGSGLGAFCFINPLFLQSGNVLSRQRMFKRSLKVRVSTESSTLLSPPLAPPPPPPLMPKKRKKCKVKKQEEDGAQAQEAAGEAQTEAPSAAPPEQQTPEVEEEEKEAAPEFPVITENLAADSNYMEPSSLVTSSHPRPLSPYLSPAIASVTLPLPPRGSPPVSPSLSPYQSPCLTPRLPLSLSPYDSPIASPSPSPNLLIPLSPFSSSSPEQTYDTPAVISRPGHDMVEEEVEQEEVGAADADGEIIERDTGVEEQEEQENLEEEVEEEQEEERVVLQMNSASLRDTDNCSSHIGPKGVTETLPPPLPDKTG